MESSDVSASSNDKVSQKSDRCKTITDSQLKNVSSISDEIPRREDNISKPNYLWRKCDRDAEVPIYTLSEGVVEGYFERCFTPTEFFIALVDDSVDNITFQSNLYATQKHKVLHLKKEELYAFIGINFLMGFHKLPSWRHYWALDPAFSVQIVRDTMSRNRFDDILSNIHVNDNSTIPHDNRDKTWKLKPMIEDLNKKFGTVYHGTRALSVDESVILFKGKSSMKQYNPLKPVKRGYKIWCIADQKGFVKKFLIYQGKNEELKKEFEGYGLGERVVMSLSQDIWNTNRIVVFDNYFTSLPLLEKLHVEGTLACGTVRVQRKGIPQLQDEKKMERDDCDYRFPQSGIGVFKWKDTKAVHLASNYHGSEMTVVGRRGKDGRKSNVTCPQIVKDCNEFMGGVDHADRLRVTYGVNRRSKKWWHRLFWGLMDIAFVNSYVIYASVMEEKLTLLDFRESVAQGLMSSKVLPAGKRYSDSSSAGQAHKRRGRVESVCPDVRLGNRGVHWPKFVKQRGRCEMCSIKGIQSRPHSLCSHYCKCFLCCNENKNCFLEYHGIE